LAIRIFCEAPDRASLNGGTESSVPTLRRRPDARSVVAVASGRGGVGKSAICINMAAALAMTGRKVALVDADLNSPALFSMLGLKPLRRFAPSEAIDPASAALGLRVVSSTQLADGEPVAFSFVESEDAPVAAPQQNGASPLMIDPREALGRLLDARFGPVDLMLIDLASGLSPLHALVDLVELTGVVFVTRPSEACVRATQDAIKLIEHDHVALLGLIENMLGFSCDSCHAVRPLYPHGSLAALAQLSQAPVLARLPFDPRLADCAERGALFIREYAEAPLAKQFAVMAANLEQATARRAAPAPTVDPIKIT